MAQQAEWQQWARAFFHSQNHEFIPEMDDGYGAVFFDLNHDALPDIYLVRFRNLNRLFLNPGAGQPFRDVTISSGLGGDLFPGKLTHLELGGSVADVNRDGRLDVLITGWQVTALMLQKNDFRFQAWTTIAGIDPTISANAGVWGDVNNDGALDVFITTEKGKNVLYVNNGYGQFREVGENWGVASTATSQSAALVDVNRDGWADLYVCNWFAPDELYRNVNGTHFERVLLPLPHLTEDFQSNGVTFGDVNNDQKLDMLVTDRQGHSRLYLNQTAPGDTVFRFVPAPDSMGVQIPYPAYGSVIADFDNDGWADIFVATIGPNGYFRNEGGRMFTPFWIDPHSRAYSTGCAVADADGDGDLDLFVANKDTSAYLYLNPLQRGAYLRVRPHGVSSNREGFGTHVWLLSEEGDSLRTIAYRYIASVQGYLSQSENVAHFGIPRGISRLSLRVMFPSGKDVWVQHLAPNQVVDVWEHRGLARRITEWQQRWARMVHKPAFWQEAFWVLFILVTIGAFLIAAGRRYRMNPLQTNVLLLILLAALYGVFLLQGREWGTRLLVTQWVVIVMVLGVTTAYLEKVYRLEQARRAYRQVLRDFAREVILIKKLPDLYGRMASAIYSALSPVAVAVYEVAENELQKRAGAGQAAMFPETLTRPKTVQLKGIWTPQEIRRLFPELAPESVSVGVPVFRETQWMALLLLGPLPNGKKPGAADTEILQILASQAAIAIENIHFIEETRELTRQLTEAQIREAYIRELEAKNAELERLNRELKETHLQLVHSEKMASLGQLVAGIAHELNNPIAFVYSNLRVLQDYMATLNALINKLNRLAAEARKSDLTPEEIRTLQEMQEDLEHIVNESLEGSRRVKEVVQNLRNFSRLDEAEFKTFDLHEGLESTLRLLAHQLKHRIQVHRDYGDIPPVYGQPGPLNQVFMNILSNAVQAIEDTGNIYIRTRREGEAVVVEIEDTGPGIPEDIQQKIFDPFFTTKPVGKGTGLGLSISYKIIKDHGGRIEVSSTVGKGTVFRIYLPVQANQKPKENNGR